MSVPKSRADFGPHPPEAAASSPAPPGILSLLSRGHTGPGAVILLASSHFSALGTQAQVRLFILGT